VHASAISTPQRLIGDTGGVIADVGELVRETGARMDVMAELRHQGAAAASLVCGLSDEQLDRAGVNSWAARGGRGT
jgi:hypothetical protein